MSPVSRRVRLARFNCAMFHAVCVSCVCVRVLCVLAPLLSLISLLLSLPLSLLPLPLLFLLLLLSGDNANLHLTPSVSHWVTGIK